MPQRFANPLESPVPPAAPARLYLVARDGKLTSERLRGLRPDPTALEWETRRTRRRAVLGVILAALVLLAVLAQLFL